MPRRPLTPEELEDAKRLRKLWNERRDDLHLNQTMAAKAFGFHSQAAISQYINARVPLNMTAAAKFAKLLRTGVDQISPRFGRLVETPIVPALDKFIPPKTGEIAGVQTKNCVDWFAFSRDFLDAIGANSLKAYRLEDASSKEHPAGTILLIDDTFKQVPADGLYLLQQGQNIILRRITTDADGLVIHNAKKLRLSKDAFSLIKILAKVIAVFQTT